MCVRDCPCGLVLFGFPVGRMCRVGVSRPAGLRVRSVAWRVARVWVRGVRMWLPEWHERSLMSRVPWSDEEERLHVVGKDPVAVQGPVVRGVAHALVRPAGRGPRVVAGVAAVEGHAGGALFLFNCLLRF